MPPSNRKHYRVAIFGELTLANCIDWCMAMTLVMLIALVTFQLGGARPDTMILSSVLLGILFFLHVLSVIFDKPKEPMRFNPLGLIFLPYLIYLGISALVLSRFVWKGEIQFLTMVQAMVVYWVTVQSFRSRSQIALLMWSLVVLGVLGMLIAIMQYFHSPEWLPKVFNAVEQSMVRVSLSSQYHGRASGFFGAPTSFAAFLLLIGFGVFVGAFSSRFSPMIRIILAYIGLMMMAGIMLSVSRGAMILMVVGLLMLPIVVRAKWRTCVVVWVAMAVVISAFSFLMYQLNDTFRERLEAAVEDGGESTRPVMWTAAWEQFLEAPVLGNGAGSYEFLFENYRPEGFNRSPAHAHNDYLEMLADLGIVGFLLFWIPVILLLYFSLREWLRQPDKVKMDILDEKRRRPWRMPTTKLIIGALGLGILLFCAHLLLEFHLQVPALLFIFMMFLAVLTRFISVKKWRIPRTTVTVLAFIIVGFGISGAIPILMMPRYLAMAHAQEGERVLGRFSRNTAQYKLNEKFINDMIALQQKAVAQNPDNAVAWSNLSNAVASQHLLIPSQSREFGKEAEEYARRSIQLYPTNPQAWLNLGNALSLQFRMVEAGRAYEKSIEYGPNRAETWHYYAAHLDLLEATRDEALVAVERALALQPGRKDSEKLRRQILVQ